MWPRPARSASHALRRMADCPALTSRWYMRSPRPGHRRLPAAKLDCSQPLRLRRYRRVEETDIGTSLIPQRRPEDSRSGADAQPELQAPRPTNRCAAEEHAFHQVLAIKDIVDVQLRTHDRSANRERVPGARIHNEVRIHVRVLVEVEQTASVGRIGIGAVGEAGPIDPRGRQIEPTTRVDRARDTGYPLIVVQVEVARR